MNKAEEKKVYPACRIEDRTVCPSHPGVILKDIYLHDLNLTVTDFAERIGVTRKTVSAIVNGKASNTRNGVPFFRCAWNASAEMA